MFGGQFELGSWLVICDRCGFRFKNYELRDERHTGLKVCKDCLDIRNPQEYAKIPRTERPIPWARPEPEDINLSATVNCDGITHIFTQFAGNEISSDLTIYKTSTFGTLTISATVSVVCELEIR